MFRLVVVWRALLDRLLEVAGIFDVAPALRRRSPRKSIAFQAYACHLAQCFAPVIARLQRDHPDIDIDFIVLLHPQFSFRSTFALRKFAHDSLHIPRKNIHFSWHVLWKKFDLLVCTDVYAKFPLRHSKTVLLKHGAGVATRILKPNILRKTIFDFDVVMVNGEADYDLVRRFCSDKFAMKRVVVAGLPYLDRLQTCEETRDAYLRRIGHSPDKKVALVAPSWRGLQMIQEAHPHYLDEIIAALRDLGWQVIIKMHACSFNKAMVGGDDWQCNLTKYLQPDIRVDRDVDDVPALVHADLLITDISSRAFNFMLLGKPVVSVMPDDLFTDDLDRERIELIKRGVFLARSPAEMRTIVANGLGDETRPRAEGRVLANRVFANRGRATEVVVDHLVRCMNGDATAQVSRLAGRS